jgi:hypothetical protein
LSFLKVSEHH